MVDVGEETGELDTMLYKVADTYDEEVVGAHRKPGQPDGAAVDHRPGRCGRVHRHRAVHAAGEADYGSERLKSSSQGEANNADCRNRVVSENAVILASGRERPCSRRDLRKRAGEDWLVHTSHCAKQGYWVIQGLSVHINANSTASATETKTSRAAPLRLHPDRIACRDHDHRDSGGVVTVGVTGFDGRQASSHQA